MREISAVKVMIQNPQRGYHGCFAVFARELSSTSHTKVDERA
jgi:hypothetical protein